GQRFSESARLLKVSRQRGLDAGDLLAQLVSRRCTLDALAFGSELTLGFRLLVRENSEGVVDAREVRGCRDDASLLFVEFPVIFEVRRQQGIPASLNCLVQRRLRRNTLGDELFAALGERGDSGFELLHGGFSEGVAHK